MSASATRKEKRNVGINTRRPTRTHDRKKHSQETSKDRQQPECHVIDTTAPFGPAQKYAATCFICLVHLWSEIFLSRHVNCTHLLRASRHGPWAERQNSNNTAKNHRLHTPTARRIDRGVATLFLAFAGPALYKLSARPTGYLKGLHQAALFWLHPDPYQVFF